MQMQEIITILTPVYNRKEQMQNLFASLCRQTNKKFIWMIIDDGSTDGLSNTIEDMQSKADFKIEYQYKSNGGKHTALNIGFEAIDTELTFIVDSDDMLTDSAIDTVIKEWIPLREKNLAGISFLCGYKDGAVIGTKFPTDGVYNSIDIRFKYKVAGDKAEVWRTDLLKKYKFPETAGEKFISENYVWLQIAFEYNMMYVNKIIYIAEYLEGGLSNLGRKLIISNPIGAMHVTRIYFNQRFSLKERIKRAWLYICYAKFAKKACRK